MNIIEAIEAPELFRPFLGDDLTSWQPWISALRVLYGHRLHGKAERQLIHQCTGRKTRLLPRDGFDTALFLTGRRSGKSRTAAIIGAYEAVIAGNEKKLSKGELGLVPIISPSKSQSRIVKGYLRSIFETPLLANEVETETREGFELKNGTRIEILAGDWRTIRGFTLLAAIVDEAAFFGVEDTKIKSDTELMRALQPSLATTGGKLIAISSPYARKGWCYHSHKKQHANDQGTTLIWNCPSRTMNPTLRQSLVDRALAEDLASAKAEYLGEFRDDIAAFVPRELVESCVIKNRSNLLPNDDHDYLAFVDVSGGRNDDSVLCIAHRENRTVMVDHIKRYRPPHNPTEVIGFMADEIKRFNIQRVTGDAYGGEFCSGAFRENGLKYEKSKLSASDLYLELLPRLCSREVELPDDETLIKQISNLERRTRSGGKDKIDHPTGQHDDIANAVAGAVVHAARHRITVGCF